MVRVIVRIALITLAISLMVYEIMKPYEFNPNNYIRHTVSVMAYDANCDICKTGPKTSSGRDARMLGAAGRKEWIGTTVEIDRQSYLIDDLSPAAENSGRIIIEVRLPTHEQAVQWGVKLKEIEAATRGRIILQ